MSFPYAQGKGRLVELGPTGITALGEVDRYVEPVTWSAEWTETEWLILFADV